MVGLPIHTLGVCSEHGMVGQAILTLGVFRAWNGWTSNTLGVCSEHGMVGLAIHWVCVQSMEWLDKQY